MFPLLSVTTEADKPVLVVNYRAPRRRRRVYPLTDEGCRLAGVDLARAGHSMFMGGSSIDHADEVDPSFKGDVRELVSAAIVRTTWEDAAPARSVATKMIQTFRQSPAYRTLSAAERAAFRTLMADYKKSMKGPS